MTVSVSPGSGSVVDVVEVLDELDARLSVPGPTTAEPMPTAIKTARTVARIAAIRLIMSLDLLLGADAEVKNA